MTTICQRTDLQTATSWKAIKWHIMIGWWWRWAVQGAGARWRDSAVVSYNWEQLCLSPSESIFQLTGRNFDSFKRQWFTYLFRLQSETAEGRHTHLETQPPKQRLYHETQFRDIRRERSRSRHFKLDYYLSSLNCFCSKNRNEENKCGPCSHSSHHTHIST